MILKRFANMLRQLFRANASSQADGPAATAARLEEKVLALVDNMPTLPDTATRAMALAHDPNSKAADFARLIERDAPIATGLLRYANGPLYAGGAPALKLQQAVVRLGIWQCRNLIASIGMKSLFRRMEGGTRAQCEVLWHHGHVTAALCRRINRAYRLGFEGEEFSAGLLHDLGRVLLVLADPDCGARAGALDFREMGDLLVRERAAIGIDHCALGGWFGEHSQLPEGIIRAIRCHHEPARTDDDRKLLALVATADHMANHLQRGEEAWAYSWLDNTGLALLWERWPEARKDRFRGEIRSMMEEAALEAEAEPATC
jgi:HD-like signal output (HDOD) protein